MVLKLRLTLLGKPEFVLNGEPYGGKLLNKTQALFYYLAATGTAHSRTALAGLLWSDMAEAEARANLRVALGQLNGVLGEHLSITRQTIQFNRADDDWLDLEQFEASFQRLQEIDENGLQAVAALYRGEFLDDLHVRGAPLFEEWVLARRTRFHEMAVEILAVLVERATKHGAYAEGLDYARRRLALEPTLEAAHRDLMRLLAYTGERGAALAQYELGRQRLQEELGIAPSAETTELYERIRSGALTAPISSPLTQPTPATKAAHNLPFHLTSFVGRDAAIADVKQMLSVNRLLTLTGIGGAGKTRLALQAGTQLLDTFAEGVWLVALAPLADPGLVAWEVASVLSIREVPGQPILDTLVESLRSKQLLLILDNCEHLLQACAGLAEALLRTCPKLHILATSRESLSVGGETWLLVPPLTLPQLDEQPSLEKVRQYEAVQLFSERATTVQPAFKVTEQNATLVVLVCRWLDGLPLAIELAAARAKLLSMEQIAARLADRFQLLTEGGRTAPLRQQTLRASIDWSYELLSETELKFFACLSVFAGGWTLEAAEGVWGDLGNGVVLDLLTRLVDKSLIVAERQLDKETRYRMLETIRQYAAEKLSATELAPNIHHQHLTVLLQLAEAAEPQLDGANQALELPRLEREVDNFRAALDWAFTNGQSEEGLRLAVALRQFWYFANHLHEGREWIGKFLKLPDADISPALRAKALHAAGYSALLQDDNVPATEWLEASLHLLRELKDTRQATHVLIHLASVKLAMGEPTLAQTYYAQSLAVMRELGDSHGIMDALWGLGVIAYNQNNYDLANTYCSEGLALAQNLNDLERQAWFLRDVGRIALARGDLAGAQPSFEQALVVSRRLGSQQLTAFTLMMLGKLRLAERDYARAEMLFDEALQQFQAFGEKYGITTVLVYLGQAATLQGQLALATERYQQSLKLLIEMSSQAYAAHVVEGLASVAVVEGHMARAARLFGAADAMRERVQTPLPPADQPDYERSVAAAHEQLSAAEWADEWEAGHRMTMEQIIADILG